LLTRLFPKVFAENATEYVFDFESVCAEAGVAISDYTITADMTDDQKHDVYSRKMKLIYKVFNGDWKADFSNDKQPKYYPWFRHTGSGFVLIDVNCCYAYTIVSARLCAKNEAIVRHICQHFLKEYNDYLAS
jgi:hypothetical protein